MLAPKGCSTLTIGKAVRETVDVPRLFEARTEQEDSHGIAAVVDPVTPSERKKLQIVGSMCCKVIQGKVMQCKVVYCKVIEINGMSCNVVYNVMNLCNGCNVCSVCSACSVCNVCNVCLYVYLYVSCLHASMNICIHTMSMSNKSYP